MACVHLNAVAHPLRPFLRRQTSLQHSGQFCRLLTSTGLNTLPPNRHERPVQPVFAQPRRSFSSKAKEAAVASPADLLFKSPLKIVEYPDPILRAKNKRVNTFDESLKNLVAEMFDGCDQILVGFLLHRTDGVGLSAPQVGINVELMVFNPVGERGEGEEIVLVNPQIKRFSRKIVPFDEGCLSFPGIYADVERPDALQVAAQDITGGRFEVNLTGLHARVFQHEYDHLQALEKKYEEKTGLPSPERIDKRRRKKKAVGFGKP
ncbi:peptide deformylase 1B [Striga asiatica]|uniref:Peptide deformylase n=1 Tax=Striga asiatica TaxID=4170 RepID=A0A5A7QBB6_STRAF|nr:peptide deformylase 1B [Striga asiatica]